MAPKLAYSAFVFACVSLEAAPVQIDVQIDTPEPGTFVMLGGGLLAVAAVLRRLRKL